VLLLFTPEVHIVLAAEENRLSELYVGQPVLIQANAYPQQTFTGTLATIASQVDPNTRTVTVTVRVSEQPGAQRLLPGMVAYVEFLQE
jgi:multidrug efflux pump subunit AcrA (membrane-fusion protein)